MTSFMQVKEGDRIERLVAETMPMELVVKKVDDKLIYATRDVWSHLDPVDHPGNYWTFDRETGIEEDEDLGWGVAQRITGSRIIKSWTKET